jgi:hypothetical protein
MYVHQSDYLNRPIVLGCSSLNYKKEWDYFRLRSFHVVVDDCQSLATQPRGGGHLVYKSCNHRLIRYFDII